MTDWLPPIAPTRPRIDVHDQRIRERAIWDKLRHLRLDRQLPLDGFYADGALSKPQWDAGHLFRDDRIALLERRAKGRARPLNAEPKDARPRKQAHGFNMRPVAIERALKVERWLSPQYLEWGIALIGERFFRLEIPQAQRVASELVRFYGVG